MWKIEALNDEQTEEPESMEKYSLGSWKGLVAGCNYSEYIKNLYHKSVCTEWNSACQTIRDLSPIKIYKYIFRYYVTYYDSDYLSLLSRVEKKNDLYSYKKGYKKCGFLDNTLVHPFCVKENEDCVINYFYFVAKDNMITKY